MDMRNKSLSVVGMGLWLLATLHAGCKNNSGDAMSQIVRPKPLELRFNTQFQKIGEFQAEAWLNQGVFSPGNELIIHLRISRRVESEKLPTKCSALVRVMSMQNELVFEFRKECVLTHRLDKKEIATLAAGSVGLTIAAHDFSSTVGAVGNFSPLTRIQRERILSEEQADTRGESWTQPILIPDRRSFVETSIQVEKVLSIGSYNALLEIELDDGTRATFDALPISVISSFIPK
jgi:hypothetical protein